jgi:hypothetical protein
MKRVLKNRVQAVEGVVDSVVVVVVGAEAVESAIAGN